MVFGTSGSGNQMRLVVLARLEEVSVSFTRGRAAGKLLPAFKLVVFHIVATTGFASHFLHRGKEMVHRGETSTD